AKLCENVGEESVDLVQIAEGKAVDVTEGGAEPLFASRTAAHQPTLETVQAWPQSFLCIPLQTVKVVRPPVEAPEVLLRLGERFVRDVELGNGHLVVQRRHEPPAEVTQDGVAFGKPDFL